MNPEFQSDVIDRLARIETRLEALVTDRNEIDEAFKRMGARLGKLESWRTRVNTVSAIAAGFGSVVLGLVYPAMILFGLAK